MSMPLLWEECKTDAQALNNGQGASGFEAAAATYSKRGWRVFPINPKGKDPLIANWKEQATTSLSRAAEWARIWPDANVGIATGQGLLVADFDGAEGETSLVRYVLRGRSVGNLPNTPIARTKKGIHVYYDVSVPAPASGEAVRKAPTLGNYVRILPGVEYRTDGGYVIAPPSRHEDGNGIVYQWIKDHGPGVALTRPPAFLLLPKNIIKLVTKAVGKVETDGEGRNATGHWLACQLRDLGVSEAPAEKVMYYYCDFVNLATLGADHKYEREEAVLTLRGTYATPARKPAGHTDDDLDIPFTDIGNAERLLQWWGKDLRCTPGNGWLRWLGTHWEKDPAYAQECAKNTAKNIIKWSLSLPNEDARKAALGWGLRSSAAQRVNGMISLASSDEKVYRRDEVMDADNWLLNLANGTLDLRSGRLRQHSRDDHITKIIPVRYDVEAKAPLWDAFLNRIMDGNRDLIEFLRRAVGYAMTPSTSEQCLFFLYGTGRNGKSTFTETITSLMGTYASRISSELLMAGRILNPEAPSPVIAGLKGTRFVVASELEEGQKWAEAKVKDLTGGDSLSGRHLNHEPIVFKPTHKLFIYGNHRPIVRGATEGIWRRIRLIPFEVTIPEAEDDTKLPDKLLMELSGILNWALQGCLEWQKHGLGLPLSVKAATDEYRGDMDVIQQFIDEVCLVGKDDKALFSEMFRAYEAWSHSRGEKGMSSVRFGEALTNKGYPSIKKGGSMFRVGIQVLGGSDDSND